jgi:hypothetical protein
MIRDETALNSQEALLVLRASALPRIVHILRACSSTVTQNSAEVFDAMVARADLAAPLPSATNKRFKRRFPFPRVAWACVAKLTSQLLPTSVRYTYAHRSSWHAYQRLSLP